MGGWLALLFALGGCFSWTQQDPPPPEDWDLAVERPCDGPRVAGVALVSAALAGGISAAIIASTTDDLGDIEERSLLVLTIPMTVVWSLDALNAFSDGRECRRYQAHRRARRGA
jgi:hypothetical protein